MPLVLAMPSYRIVIGSFYANHFQATGCHHQRWSNRLNNLLRIIDASM
jgi:hypothetical protein